MDLPAVPVLWVQREPLDFLASAIPVPRDYLDPLDL